MTVGKSVIDIISDKKFEGIKKKILFIKSSNVRKSLSEFALQFIKINQKI